MDFRKEGRADLGDQYFELLRELSEDTLADTTFIVYGNDANYAPHLFEVSPPGTISDRRQLRYAVIGSGIYMANASLRSKPLDFASLDAITYRLLAAKFSAETATGVGKSTTLSIKAFGQGDEYMSSNTIEKIRDIWDEETKKGEPREALDIISNMASHVRHKTNEDVAS